MNQGRLTIDANGAGVILDGSKMPDGWDSAFQALSNDNIISGFTIVNFSGPGIQISGGQNNLIEKNVISGNDYGIGIWGSTTSWNKIKENYIGISADGITSQAKQLSWLISSM